MVQVSLNSEVIRPAKVAQFCASSQPAIILISPSLRADRLTNILLDVPQALEKNIEQVVFKLNNNNERDRVYKPALARVLAYAIADFEEQTKQAPTDLAVFVMPASVIVANDHYAGLYKFIVIVDLDEDDKNFVITQRIQLGKVFYMRDSIAIADKTRTVLLRRTSGRFVEVANELITVDDLKGVLCGSEL